MVATVLGVEVVVMGCRRGDYRSLVGLLLVGGHRRGLRSGNGSCWGGGTGGVATAAAATTSVAITIGGPRSPGGRGVARQIIGWSSTGRASVRHWHFVQSPARYWGAPVSCSSHYGCCGHSCRRLTPLQLVKVVAEAQVLDVIVVLTVLHVRGRGGSEHVPQVAQRRMVRLVGASAGGAHIVRHMAAARRFVAVRCGLEKELVSKIFFKGTPYERIGLGD